MTQAMSRTQRVKVSCPNDGEVMTFASSLIIDDEQACYRFTCPRCLQPIAKRMDDEIRALLRDRIGAATIDELVESAAALLEDDANIWRSLKGGKK